MVEWLEEVWSRTHAVQIVEGGEGGGPLLGRAVLAELVDAVSVDAVRVLTTTGRFTGDVCRCPGGLTVMLRDIAGAVLASASLHGYGSVSWERSWWRNDLVVADPAALHLFLAGHGVPNQLTALLAPLADLLNLHEGRPQFRPAGKAGKRYLTERGVPDVLHPVLVAVTGQQSGELSDAQVDDARRRLTAAMPSPAGRAAVLLSWLGRLCIPAEALWGEGVLVRQLLADLAPPDIATAVAETRTGEVAMGVVNLVMHSGDDGMLATAVDPTLRQLFPPAPATGTVR
ncbi:hypothetical protein [Plantactinospora endophytica]|uniref:Uncharacterized protein n=1 Tax=Plantactinospora endophytica TaxID=673535 RepID=A0ABQ4EFC6_9ACTN|nr:hypothetical protein [Plantactinospora endophytica]GIG93423.1 hypothetical protein Pen02_83590 [Plantactinospora endophytica]